MINKNTIFLIMLVFLPLSLTAEYLGWKNQHDQENCIFINHFNQLISKKIGADSSFKR
jgi:hypothetical protein